MSHYKPYASYKNSGIEWIGQVPDNWSLLRLASVGPLMKANGGNKEDDKDSGIPCVRYGDLYTTYDLLIRDVSKFINPEAETDYTTIKYGDILFAASGETFEDIGKSAVNLSESHACCGGDVIVLRPQRTIDPLFLAYATGSSSAQVQKSLMGKGFTVIHIYGDQIRNLVIASPPENEQKVIGTKIESETKRIDSLIAKKSRFIELIKEKITALASLPPDSPNLKWVRLSHVCEVISRPVIQEPGSSYTKLGLFNRGRGIFKRDETDTEDMGDSEFFWVQPGDLILSGQFAWEGAVALANEEHAGCVASHRFPVIRGSNNEALTEYLLAYFLTAHGDFVLNDCSRGSAGRNRPLNMNLLLRWKIPIPSMQIQREVARLVQMERRIGERVNKSIVLLKERRSAFITAAVTGQIDLRESA